MGFWAKLFGGGKPKPVKMETGKASGPGADIIHIASAPKKGGVSPAASAVIAPPPAPPKLPAARAADGVSGFGQARLRMQLVAAQRAGDLDAAYEAARELEAIQMQAGRRVGARLWREQAERIGASL